MIRTQSPLPSDPRTGGGNGRPLAGAYFANRKSAALIAYRLEELEKRVQAHNNLVERIHRLEEAFKTHEELASERLKAANHRIEDLEKSTD